MQSLSKHLIARITHGISQARKGCSENDILDCIELYLVVWGPASATKASQYAMQMSLLQNYIPWRVIFQFWGIRSYT